MKTDRKYTDIEDNDDEDDDGEMDLDNDEEDEDDLSESQTPNEKDKLRVCLLCSLFPSSSLHFYDLCFKKRPF